jgi:hypothetical protein
MHIDFAFLAVARPLAAAFKPNAPEGRALQDDLISIRKRARAVAATIYGAPVADFFSGDSVRPADVLAATESLFRLIDHGAPPRPRTVDAPVIAASPLEARLAKLEFAELERQRAQKASELWAVMKEKTEPFKSYLYDGKDDWTWADIIRAGLVRATIIDWDHPDKAGLQDLETILRGDIASPELRAACFRISKFRAEVAEIWKAFDEFAAAHCADDEDLADARDLRFDPDRVCTLEDAITDYERALATVDPYVDRAAKWQRVQWANKQTRAAISSGATEFK